MKRTSSPSLDVIWLGLCDCIVLAQPAVKYVAADVYVCCIWSDVSRDEESNLPSSTEWQQLDPFHTGFSIYTNMFLLYPPVGHRKKLNKMNACSYNVGSSQSIKNAWSRLSYCAGKQIVHMQTWQESPHLLFARWKIAQSDRSMFVCEHLCFWVLFTVRMSSLHKPQRCCGNTKTEAGWR